MERGGGGSGRERGFEAVRAPARQWQRKNIL